MKNNHWAKVNIKYLWWIEDEKKWTSLTWSSTLMKIKEWKENIIRILIDYGMHQWWKNQDKLNETIENEALHAKYLIITHAHMDHIWRLPMLVKKWFKWKIIMTDLTKQLAQVMLSDYVKLTEEKMKKIREQNKKIWKTFREYLQIINLYNEFSNWWLKRNIRLKKEEKLKSLIWLEIKNWWINNTLVKWKIKEIKSILYKNHIEKESNIKSIQQKEPKLLYTLDDVYKTISLIETIKVWDNLDLDNRKVITNLDDEKTFDLPKILNSKHDKKTYILAHLKQKLLTELKYKLDEIAKNNTKNRKLREELKNAFNKKNKQKKDIDLLEKYNIKSKEDIELLIKDIINFPYNYDDIENIKNNLQIITNKNQGIIDNIELMFHNAGHIEWSVQATISITTKKIINTLNTKWKNTTFKWRNQTVKETKNFWFSWDLWKISDPNISWQPNIPKDIIYNFFQCESTYADKDHTYKKSEFEKFIKEINEAEWKVLIPAFSLQRTQEILLDLIKNKIERKNLIKKYSELNKEIRKLNKNLIEISRSLEQKDIYQRQYIIENEIQNKLEELNNISEQVFLYDIIVDSPLSKKITDIFLNNLWEKYKLLDNEIQKKEFWKGITTYFENKNEYKKLYKGKRKRTKDIIVSAWWMLQWGSIINHLKEIISDPKAKIIFTGYQAKWTLWRELLEGKKEIIIDWEIYNVNCKIIQIWWYSSHIWKKDLIDYLSNRLNFSKNSIIALNHWWEWRKHLLYEVNKLKPKQKIKIPKIWDNIEIKL